MSDSKVMSTNRSVSDLVDSLRSSVSLAAFRVRQKHLKVVPAK